jgi:hypothetical protein
MASAAKRVRRVATATTLVIPTEEKNILALRSEHYYGNLPRELQLALPTVNCEGRCDDEGFRLYVTSSPLPL